MTPPKQSFFIVWSPQSDRSPRVQHVDFESASVEASRLANLHKGQDFYVLAARRRILIPQTAIVEDFADYDDGIPF